jgi:hypothetical protein
VTRTIREVPSYLSQTLSEETIGNVPADQLTTADVVASREEGTLSVCFPEIVRLTFATLRSVLS